MKHCVLITAYKDFPQLERLIDRLCNMAVVYVHVDKKSPREELIRLKSKYAKTEGIRFFSEYRIRWGSFSHLRAILFLLHSALEDKDAHLEETSYIHVISGADYPVRADLSYFEDKSSVYMTCSPLSETTPLVQERYIHKHFFAAMDLPGKFYLSINRLLKRIHLSDTDSIGPFSLKDIYKGMIWVSMPIVIMQYVLDYMGSKCGRYFYRSLKRCEVPEEVFFQTIIMNSAFRDSVVNDNLRFTLWEFKNGSIPAILDTADYTGIKESRSVFCRKIDSAISKGLLERIDAGDE